MLFLAGDFNKWTPGDNRYRFTRVGPDLFSIELPGRFRHSSFKLNRGTWENQPCDQQGLDWPDKRFSDFPGGKAVLEVGYWSDKFWEKDAGTLFIIKELPPDTPANPDIFMSSSQSGWTLSDPAFRFKKNAEGRYELRIKRPPGTSMMEYKLNLGSWASVETDSRGRDIDNRWHEYSLNDTVLIKVKGWKKH